MIAGTECLNWLDERSSLSSFSRISACFITWPSLQLFPSVWLFSQMQSTLLRVLTWFNSLKWRWIVGPSASKASVFLGNSSWMLHSLLKTFLSCNCCVIPPLSPTKQYWNSFWAIYPKSSGIWRCKTANATEFSRSRSICPFLFSHCHLVNVELQKNLDLKNLWPIWEISVNFRPNEVLLTTAESPFLPGTLSLTHLMSSKVFARKIR